MTLGPPSPPQDPSRPSLIRDFEEAFDKRVIVKVSQGFTNYLTEQLHRGTLDVAFCGKRDNEPDIGSWFPPKAKGARSTRSQIARFSLDRSLSGLAHRDFL